LEKGSRDWIHRSKLGEYQSDQQLAGDDDRHQPQVSWSAGAEAQYEQGVDADDRREICKGDAEVREQTQGPAQLWAIAESLQLPAVGIVRGCRLVPDVDPTRPGHGRQHPPLTLRLASRRNARISSGSMYLSRPRPARPSLSSKLVPLALRSP
jgi:hypothetical protein